MEDIIGQGEDRPPGGRRRIWWIAAAAVVAALIIAEHLPHGGSPGPRHPAARGTIRIRVRHIRVQGPGVLAPTGKPGKVTPWAADIRLPRATSRPAWFWPAQPRVAPIRGLPADHGGYVFTRVGGGWAIQPGSCGQCTGPPAPVYFLPDQATQVSRVGTASLVAPAAVTGSVWLTSYPPASAGTPGVARQYTGTGAAVGSAVRLPAGYRIVQGTSHGLLLAVSDPAGHAVTYQQWDPATGKVLRSFRGVLAVSATEVAYAPPCQVRCLVRILSLRTGRATVITLAADNIVLAAKFSPDGRFLALEVGDNNPDGASAIRLEVASMPGGHLVIVPHTNVSGDALNGFGWPARGDDLVAEFSFVGQVQTVLWDQPAGQLAVADVSPGQDPFSLVTG